MAIQLEKGQKINLEKSAGKKLSHFCVGCNWGAIIKKNAGLLGIFGKKDKIDVDLDLSCILLNASGEVADYIYSPDYRIDFLQKYNCGQGKLSSRDGALYHSGDDRHGDVTGNDGIDNEFITVDLEKINPEIDQIFFFINNAGTEDFSQIPYAAIRMFERRGNVPGDVFASYDAAALPQYAGKRAMIMGKLYKKDNNWYFAAIGDATADQNMCETIERIRKDYLK